MNNFQIRAFVRQIIAEAKSKKDDKKPVKKDDKKTMKKEEKLPKSSGKLIDLKRELAALKQMKDELQAAKFAEKTASTEVEFADLQKFAAELDKIKQGGVALEQSIDTRISELEGIIADEKNKIKEMIGLAPKQDQEKIEDVKQPELDEAKKPSAGMTKKEKSSVVKKARAGKDIGKAGKGFEKVAKAAGGEKGKKIAAAAMWKQQAKK